MGQYGAFNHGPSGASAWLIYNDQNLRIKQIGWDNPSAFDVRVWIWEDGVLAHEVVLSAGSAGEQNVAGNYQLQQLEDPEFGTILKLPEGVTYRMQWPG